MLSRFKQHACSTHFKIQFQHHLENHVDNNKLSFICRVVSNHQKLFSFPMLYGSRGYRKKMALPTKVLIFVLIEG